MKANWKVCQIALLFITLIFSGCNPDKTENDPEPALEDEPCRLTKIISSTGNYIQEYKYDGNNRLVRINGIYSFDTTFNWTKYYTYNAAGKVIEESEYYPLDKRFLKKVFIYNLNNQISKVDQYENGSWMQEKFYQYSADGKLILIEIYSGQPAKLTYYIDFTYYPDKLISKEYDAQITPATLKYDTKYTFDDKKSIYSGLEFMEIILPGITKHNILDVDMVQDEFDSYSSYKYNQYGYPIECETRAGMFGFKYIYEYNCQ